MEGGYINEGNLHFLVYDCVEEHINSEFLYVLSLKSSEYYFKTSDGNCIAFVRLISSFAG